MQSIEEIVQRDIGIGLAHGLNCETGFAAYRRIADLIEFGTISGEEFEKIFNEIQQANS